MNFSAFIFLAIFTLSAVQAKERIISFDVDMIVRKDASVFVRESITVFCERKEIVRGIVRDIPTRYSGVLGTIYEAPITIQSVAMDGHSTPYTVKQVVDGVIITIKDEANLLPLGRHTFVVEYIVNWQVAFFDNSSEIFWASVPGVSLLKACGNMYRSSRSITDTGDEPHEELYWNAVGTGCRFMIEKATARVVLPNGVPASAIRVAGFRGEHYECDLLGFDTSVDAQGVAYFSTTKPLSPKNGFTIVVGWPVGFVERPSFWRCCAHFVYDNPFFLLMLFSLITLFVIAIIALVRMKRANRPGIIIPLFYPPHEILPGLARFIVRQRGDEKCLAAEIVQMAVDGFLTIHYKPSSFGAGTYSLKKIADLPAQESFMRKKVFEYLFQRSATLVIDARWENRDSLIGAQLFLTREYERRYAGQYFDDNSFWVGLIFLLSCLSIALIGLGMSFSGKETWFGIFIGSLLLINLVVNKYSQTYSEVGRALVDQLAGFKLFLTTAEVERLRVVGTPPTRTPELYEKYLPYAMALDVEQEWSYQFAPIFAQYAQVGKDYAPAWFSGQQWSLLGANALGNQMAKAVHGVVTHLDNVNNGSKISTPPGDRPGSNSGFGGGYTGGGGGGGGVGGC